MKDYRKYVLWYGVGCLILPQISYAMTCEEAPDCTALGFKVAGSEVKSKCNGLSRMKCPFGDFYFCSEKKCELDDYPYTKSNCNYNLGGSTCEDAQGTHYKECIQSCDTSKYPYTSSNCEGSVSGTTCRDSSGTHYSACVCDYYYTSSNCTSPKEPSGKSCYDGTQYKYSSCSCSSDYKYSSSGCSGTLSGGSCCENEYPWGECNGELYYKSCDCGDEYKYTKQNCSGNISGSICVSKYKDGYYYEGNDYATECCTSGCCIGYFYYSDDTCGKEETKSGTTTLGLVVSSGKVLGNKVYTLSNMSSVEDFILACSVYNEGGKSWYAPSISDLQAIRLDILHTDGIFDNNFSSSYYYISSTGTASQVYTYRSTGMYSDTGRGGVYAIKWLVETKSLPREIDYYDTPSCMFNF